MKGKGWHNESRRHSLASRGISSAQRIQVLSRLNKNPVKNKDVAFVRKLRENILRKMFMQKSEGFFTNPDVFKPFLDEFSVKDDDYIPGDIFYSFAKRVMPESQTFQTYLSSVKGETDKEKLRNIVYSKDPQVMKEVRELDLDVIQFLARNKDYKYKIVTTKSGREKLVTYSQEFRKEKPEFFKQLIKKVKDER
jgi:hypothetical protein